MPSDRGTGFGFPARRRLRRSRDFDRVYRGGRRYRLPGCSLICRENESGELRLGLSIQKKTGNAVLRNRIKRILRETFRLHPELFPRGCDVVFAVRPGFSLLSPANVGEALQSLQLGRLRGDIEVEA